MPLPSPRLHADRLRVRVAAEVDRGAGLSRGEKRPLSAAVVVHRPEVAAVGVDDLAGRGRGGDAKRKQQAGEQEGGGGTAPETSVAVWLPSPGASLWLATDAIHRPQ